MIGLTLRRGVCGSGARHFGETAGGAFGWGDYAANGREGLPYFTSTVSTRCVAGAAVRVWSCQACLALSDAAMSASVVVFR